MAWFLRSAWEPTVLDTQLVFIFAPLRETFFLRTIFFLVDAAYAKNVDISTVSARQSVQLTIYNSEELTLDCCGTNGLVDEVCIYKRALTDTEIKQMYESQK